MEPFSSACRLCLWKGDKMIDVFRCNQKYDILDKIHKCLPIKFQKTDVTHVICHNCYYKLEIFAEFLTVCSRSDAILKRYIESQNTSPSKEPLDYRDSRVITIHDSSDDAATEDEDAFVNRRGQEKSKPSASTVIKHDISQPAVTNQVSATLKHSVSRGQQQGVKNAAELTNEQSKQALQKLEKPKSAQVLPEQSASKVQQAAVPAEEPSKQAAPKPAPQMVKKQASEATGLEKQTAAQDKLPAAQPVTSAATPEKQATPPKKAAAPQDKQSPAQTKQPATPEKREPVQDKQQAATPKKAVTPQDKQSPAQNKQSPAQNKQSPAQNKQSPAQNKQPAATTPEKRDPVPDKQATPQKKTAAAAPDKQVPAQNKQPAALEKQVAEKQLPEKQAAAQKKQPAPADKQPPVQSKPDKPAPAQDKQVAPQKKQAAVPQVKEAVAEKQQAPAEKQQVTAKRQQAAPSPQDKQAAVAAEKQQPPAQEKQVTPQKKQAAAPQENQQVTAPVTPQAQSPSKEALDKQVVVELKSMLDQERAVAALMSYKPKVFTSPTRHSPRLYNEYTRQESMENEILPAPIPPSPILGGRLAAMDAKVRLMSSQLRSRLDGFKKKKKKKREEGQAKTSADVRVTTGILSDVFQNSSPDRSLDVRDTGIFSVIVQNFDPPAASPGRSSGDFGASCSSTSPADPLGGRVPVVELNRVCECDVCGSAFPTREALDRHVCCTGRKRKRKRTPTRKKHTRVKNGDRQRKRTRSSWPPLPPSALTFSPERPQTQNILESLGLVKKVEQLPEVDAATAEDTDYETLYSF